MNIDELRQNINIQMKKLAEKENYKSTLWISNVKGFYEQYEYNLGYLRNEGKKSRINRPAIIVNKEGKHYRIFFLSSLGKGYDFKIENCKYQYCKKTFYWEKSSRIFIKYRKKGKIRFIFLLHEDDLENLMDFCAPCNDEYIQNITNKKKKCLMKF